MIRIDTLMDEILFAVTNTLTLQAIKAIDARDVLMDVEIFSTIYWQYRKTRDDYDVMNRFGHCVSYNFVEDFETELALVLLRNLSYCLKVCFADRISTLELPLIVLIFSLKRLREKIRYMTPWES
jgi:hypothetical protein